MRSLRSKLKRSSRNKVRRSKRRNVKVKRSSKVRRSIKRRNRSKRDGMDKPIIRWQILPATPGGIPLSKGYEEYKIDWTGYVPRSKSRSYEEIKRRQAAYAKWKKKQENLS